MGALLPSSCLAQSVLVGEICSLRRPMSENGGTFAQQLTRIVEASRGKQRDRARQGERWIAHEAKLLDVAVELFKLRCTRAAEQQQFDATVSFEVLTREVPGFPTRVVKDSTYLVDGWGDGAAEYWFYATRGTAVAWTPGTPVLFAEVLEGMIGKFVDKAQGLGFRACYREPGTWKVTASWGAPDEQAAKKARKD
eukprot:CAMPEP_0204524810 /NCGR_PEP_ID=MMETSP0661-20131031/7574_1 /ASSEMBLY_ACC=CAM_ASM_000606 /TAXON_ID=109239 /ORGANISM="Alexandrium margalefi, Strain AMGDE01CS-322" /LENGTH=194 /DNA_ID=CAMNT_0051530577 /DNA_START=36 /DNA_END=620 /DNA_ORIENTATION=+